MFSLVIVQIQLAYNGLFQNNVTFVSTRRANIVLPFKCYVTQWGGGGKGCQLFREKSVTEV